MLGIEFQVDSIFLNTLFHLIFSAFSLIIIFSSFFKIIQLILALVT